MATARTTSKESTTPASTRKAWLRGVFIAPLLLFLGVAVLQLFAFGASGIFQAAWTVLLAPIAALVYGAMLAMVDFVLSLVRLRKLPVGFGAYVSSAITTLVCGLVAYVLRQIFDKNDHAPYILIAMLVTMTMARLVLGSKPGEAADLKSDTD